MARLIQLIGGAIFFVAFFNGAMLMFTPQYGGSPTLCIGGGSLGLLMVYFAGRSMRSAKEERRHQELLRAAQGRQNADHPSVMDNNYRP